MQCHHNIRLGIPQTEMYTVKINTSKNAVVAFIHTSKIALGVIHFQDLQG